MLNRHRNAIGNASPHCYTHIYPARACAARGKVISRYPARACAARGKVISRVVSIKNLQFFWNQSFISQNTHFQSSISTQIGFSSNLMASDTAQKLNKSSWPSQNPIVCRFR